MKKADLLRLKGFYQNELIRNILGFWLPRCEDRENGGYLNCFDNTGSNLVSRDKYTWSQGRFLWVFSKLASTSLPIFTAEERSNFLRLAKNGRDFLMSHCLIAEDDVRCVFLMEQNGTAKYVDGYKPLDMSIYADCFVILGMNAYAKATGDVDAYSFGKKIYKSVLSRIGSGEFYTLPYPLSKKYRAHGIPMIMTNVTQEMLETASLIDTRYCKELRVHLKAFSEDVLFHFVDENGVIHEVISADNSPAPGLLGGHANPGHSIEDMWFQLTAAETLDRKDLIPKIVHIVDKTLEIGWDFEYGGLLHYVGVNGEPVVSLPIVGGEITEDQVLNGWGDKLWWIHSEALYTTLLCYFKTGEDRFWQWHETIFNYVFETFPNRDPEIREWKQICCRDGKPQDKVVALPVKDPYHITRNLLLILEMLEKCTAD